MVLGFIIDCPRFYHFRVEKSELIKNTVDLQRVFESKNKNNLLNKVSK